MTEFRSFHPTTGQLATERPEAGPEEIDRVLARAHDAQLEWATAPLAERTQALESLAEALESTATSTGRLLTEEMGKPLTQAVAEIRKCAYACRHAAEKAPEWLADEAVPTEARRSWVEHDPLGPVLAIMPWNFPFWQLFRFGASALAAGNSIVLKHAPNVPRCAEAIVSVAEKAGLPDGLIVNVFAPVKAIDGMIADPRIAGVTLTGSTRAGLAVAASCARHLKKSVLELGGSDPFIVLRDADVERAAQVAAQARLQNNGQSCIAAKRFLVVRAVAEPFLAAFVAEMDKAVLADPMLPTTILGPMARADLRDELHRQVLASIQKGATVQTGGEVPQRDGFWYPSTVVTDVGPGMPVWDEETFGPAAAVRVVDEEDDAIAEANASPYALGASVWTEDRSAAPRLAKRLRGGALFLNALVKSDPRLPFGGVGISGWGRELGRIGMLEFTTTRSVWVE